MHFPEGRGNIPDFLAKKRLLQSILISLLSAHIGLLFSNMIVGLFYLFAGGDFGQTFGLGLLYFVLFTPVSFVCWFRPAYKAFRDDSSFNFMVFFFVFFFQFCMSALNFLGIGNTGSWYDEAIMTFSPAN